MKIRKNSDDVFIEKEEYHIGVTKSMDLASRSHSIQLENDNLIGEVIKLDESDDDKFTKRQRAMKQIVCSLYSNK